MKKVNFENSDCVEILNLFQQNSLLELNLKSPVFTIDIRDESFKMGTPCPNEYSTNDLFDKKG